MNYGMETIEHAAWYLSAEGWEKRRYLIRTGKGSDLDIIRQKIERGDKAGLTARINEDGVCTGYNNWGILKILAP